MLRETEAIMSNHSRISQSIADAYFTPGITSDFCIEILKDYQWVTANTKTHEPCAGNGSLLQGLPGSVIKGDIHDYGIGAKIENFLEAAPKGANLIFTNPPFGRAGSLALKFLQKASKECNRLAFILPASFRKVSMLDRVPKDFALVGDFPLPDQNYILPDGTTRKVLTTFQLWECSPSKRPTLSHIAPYQTYTKRVPPAEAEFAFRTQGASAGRVLPGLDYNPASTAFLRGGLDRIQQHNWTTIAKFTAGIPAMGLNDVALGLWLEDQGYDLTDYLTVGAPYVLTNLATLTA